MSFTCFKWKNFCTFIEHELKDLRSSERYADVTLYCEGKTIQAHKIVLSSCSVYFRSIFKDHPQITSEVILADISFHQLEVLVQFMYDGEVFIDLNEVEELMAVANFLGIPLGFTEEEELIKTEQGLKTATKRRQDMRDVEDKNSNTIKKLKVCSTPPFKKEKKAAAKKKKPVIYKKVDDPFYDEHGDVCDMFYEYLELETIDVQNIVEVPSTDLNTASADLLNTHTSEDTTAYGSPQDCIKCVYCHKFTLSNANSLLEHCRQCTKVSRLGIESKFTCVICPYRTREHGNMRKHLRIHLNEKCFQCEFCPYSTTRESALAVHSRNHTGEKPYICPEESCTYRSSSYSGLYQHKKKGRHLMAK